jgi:hypothetical protein
MIRSDSGSDSGNNRDSGSNSDNKYNGRNGMTVRQLQNNDYKCVCGH